MHYILVGRSKEASRIRLYCVVSFSWPKSYRQSTTQPYLLMEASIFQLTWLMVVLECWHMLHIWYDACEGGNEHKPITKQKKKKLQQVFDMFSGIHWFSY